MDLYQKLILDIIELNTKQKLNIEDLKAIKRDFAKENKLSDIPTNIKLIRAYQQLVQASHIPKSVEIENLLKKRAIRSQSGIVAVQVLTKPYMCPGKCIFCPSEKWMPKSYISTEPGAMRAALNQFDPIKQTYNRLLSLTMTGHQTDKIEMIVLWWTRDVYPGDYKIEFIKSLYDACNNFSKLKFDLPDTDAKHNSENSDSSQKSRYSYDITNLDKIKYSSSLQESIKINETADNRIIWLTIETRPEYMTDANCQLWREMWVTRLEMWVQSMYDDVLDANKRWHSVQTIRNAIHKMRQYGFKFSIHIMPWLYKSNYDKDLWTFEQIYNDPFIKPDEIKFYPTSVIPNTELNDLYEAGDYKPLTIDIIQTLIKKTFQEIIPPYTRIKRLIRDIPATEIAAWSNVTNLSQLTHNSLKKEFKSDTAKAQKLYSRLYWDYKLFSSVEEFIAQWKLEIVFDPSEEAKMQTKTYIIWQEPDIKTYRDFVTLDTRSREIRNKPQSSLSKKSQVQKPNLIIRQYSSSVWTEYFISFEDLQWYLYGFARLLLPQDWNTVARDWLWDNTALIRELHVYGQLASLKEDVDSDSRKQHKWFGTQLMNLAEDLSKLNWFKRLSVISWVWVRWYYEKIWYDLEGTYMIKKL